MIKSYMRFLKHLSSPSCAKYVAHGVKQYVHETAVLIGDIEVGDNVSIWPLVTIRADVGKVSIGKDSNIQDGTVIHVTGDWYGNGGHFTTIGRMVSIGHRGMLHGCTIEDNCLIGMSSTVMDGAIVEENSIIGAGSLVPPGKIITSGLWTGIPARFKRHLSQDEFDSIRNNAEHYIWLKDQYLKHNNLPV